MHFLVQQALILSGIYLGAEIPRRNVFILFYCGTNAQFTFMYSFISLRCPAAQGALEVEVRTVIVEKGRCDTCWAQPWASDNWRTTGMLNFNNFLVMDIRILVAVRGFYMKGLPIQPIFEQIFAPSKSDCMWMEQNPTLAGR